MKNRFWCKSCGRVSHAGRWTRTKPTCTVCGGKQSRTKVAPGSGTAPMGPDVVRIGDTRYGTDAALH